MSSQLRLCRTSEGFVSTVELWTVFEKRWFLYIGSVSAYFHGDKLDLVKQPELNIFLFFFFSHDPIDTFWYSNPAIKIDKTRCLLHAFRWKNRFPFEIYRDPSGTNFRWEELEEASRWAKSPGSVEHCHEFLRRSRVRFWWNDQSSSDISDN